MSAKTFDLPQSDIGDVVRSIADRRSIPVWDAMRVLADLYEAKGGHIYFRTMGARASSGQKINAWNAFHAYLDVLVPKRWEGVQR